jgi:hypothetical protein
MNVIYTSDNERPTLMPLDTLIANFNVSGGWCYHASAEDMRQELESRGWYEGVHDNGHYLVLVPRKLGVEPLPELHDAHDARASLTENVGSTTWTRPTTTLDDIDPVRCQHRDDGRGRCIDCGTFL